MGELIGLIQKQLNKFTGMFADNFRGDSCHRRVEMESVVFNLFSFQFTNCPHATQLIAGQLIKWCVSLDFHRKLNSLQIRDGQTSSRASINSEISISNVIGFSSSRVGLLNFRVKFPR
jgi:hypothetical protein